MTAKIKFKLKCTSHTVENKLQPLVCNERILKNIQGNKRYTQTSSQLIVLLVFRNIGIALSPFYSNMMANFQNTKYTLKKTVKRVFSSMS